MLLDHDHNTKPMKECVDLSDLREKSCGVLHPHKVKKKTCTLMLISNLANPVWVFVECNHTHLYHTVCATEAHDSPTQISLNSSLFEAFCQQSVIKKKDLCLSFVWVTSSSELARQRQPSCRKEINADNLRGIMPLFETVSSQFPPMILVEKNISKIHVFTDLVHQNQLSHRFKKVPSAYHSGFILCSNALKTVKRGINMFSCKDGSVISVSLVCDGSIDCHSDNSDEEFCNCSLNKSLDLRHMFCKTMSVATQCGPLYFKDFHGICQQYSTLTAEDNRQTTMFGQQFPRIHIYLCRNNESGICNDLFVDCFPSAEDEPALKMQEANNTFFQCTNPYELQCKVGHPACFNISDICIFIFHINNLFPCRNGGHLESCEKFECSTKFKCYLSYCVPWSYVCDNKWDCPTGTDETKAVCQKTFVCESLFKCKGGHHTCVHVGDVCNGLGDCPQNDDEVACELHNMFCPKCCDCLFLAVQCNQNASKADFTRKVPFLYVSFIGTTEVATVLFWFSKALFCILNNNQLKHITLENLSGRLILLDLSFNNLESIKSDLLPSKFNLSTLLIVNNDVTCVEAGALRDLPKLKLLNISSNPLIYVSRTNLKQTFHMKIFSLRNVTASALPHGFLQQLPVDITIDSTDYYVCCQKVPDQKCFAEKAWHVSCALLPHKGLAAMFGADGFLILSFSVTSALIHIFLKQASRAFEMTVVGVNITDIFCGFFLLIIFVADILFKRVFVLSGESWRQSQYCFLASFFVVLFAIMSPMTLIFLSLSRLMIVLEPVDTSFKRTGFVIKWLLSIFLGALILSLSCQCFFVFTSGLQPFTLCLPLIDPSGAMTFALVVTLTLVLTHTATSVAMVIVHIMLIRRLILSQKNIQKSKTQKPNTMLVAQLVVVSVTSILCWTPTDVIYMVVMFVAPSSTALITWATVAGMPLNSLINPLVFVVVALKKYHKQRTSK